MPFDPHDPHPDTLEALLVIARRMARRWCSTHADAEDAAQEAIVRLWSCRAPPRNAVTWLAVVTRRLCNRDRLRRATRHRAEELYAAALAHGHRIPLDLLLDVDRIADHLSARDRRLLQHLVEGDQTREIAASLACAYGDVGQMVSRLRSKVRRLRDSLRPAQSESPPRRAPPVGPDKN